MNSVRTVIVDDDFLVAKVHSAYTERVPGFQVVGVAHSGHEALDVVERLEPDLLVLDVYLPDGARVMVQEGQKTRAGETILAELATGA